MGHDYLFASISIATLNVDSETNNVVTKVRQIKDGMYYPESRVVSIFNNVLKWNKVDSRICKDYCALVWHKEACRKNEFTVGLTDREREIIAGLIISIVYALLRLMRGKVFCVYSNLMIGADTDIITNSTIVKDSKLYDDLYPICKSNYERMLDYPEIGMLINNIQSWIDKIVDNLKTGDLNAFRDNLTVFLASIPYSVRRKKEEREFERYFHSLIYLMMRIISGYVVYYEKETSQGRADCVIETDSFVYVFEFKLDKTASEALKQIDDKGYAREYGTDNRTVYKVGCSISSETGTVKEFKYCQHYS